MRIICVSNKIKGPNGLAWLTTQRTAARLDKYQDQYVECTRSKLHLELYFQLPNHASLLWAASLATEASVAGCQGTVNIVTLVPVQKAARDAVLAGLTRRARIPSPVIAVERGRAQLSAFLP